MKAILFDLDGTLTDPREGITRSLAHALERMGLAPPPMESLTFAIGPPLRLSIAQLIGHIADSHFSICAAAATWSSTASRSTRWALPRIFPIRPS